MKSGPSISLTLRIIVCLNRGRISTIGKLLQVVDKDIEIWLVNAPPFPPFPPFPKIHPPSPLFYSNLLLFLLFRHFAVQLLNLRYYKL